MTFRAFATFCIAAAALLQVSRAQSLGDTHTAPESPHFPAAWYPATDTIASIPLPVTGKPYTATQVTVGAVKGTDGNLHTVTLRGAMMRDSDGRVRTEQPRPRAGADGTPREARLVDVQDPVSHCHMLWEEPWLLEGQPIAVAKCSAKTVRYVTTPLSHMVDAHDGEVTQGTEVIVTVHLPEAAVNGVQALGVQYQHETPQPDGTRKPGMTTEMWYSPDLQEIVQLHNTFPAAGSAAMPPHNLDLQDVKRIEPAPALFYPPSGYEIRH